MNDNLGDRMKAYEAVETNLRLDSNLPIYARLDGRGFSKFTKGLNRPYDERFSQIMRETARLVGEHTNAALIYTQSDEISLAWFIDREKSPDSETMFGGKTHKLNSVLASLTTSIFMSLLSKSNIAEYAERLPHFDCRVMNLPTVDEVANAFIWREIDAARNAVSMVAHHHFSHSSLQGVGSADMLKRLFEEKGIHFEKDMPEWFRFGTYFSRQPRVVFSEHTGGDIVRSKIAEASFRSLRTIENRVEVIFEGASPLLR